MDPKTRAPLDDLLRARWGGGRLHPARTATGKEKRGDLQEKGGSHPRSYRRGEKTVKVTTAKNKAKK